MVEVTTHLEAEVATREEATIREWVEVVAMGIECHLKGIFARDAKRKAIL
jgi:hypothetical protein